jgi:hypothetical protein
MNWMIAKFVITFLPHLSIDLSFSKDHFPVGKQMRILKIIIIMVTK